MDCMPQDTVVSGLLAENPTASVIYKAQGHQASDFIEKLISYSEINVLADEVVIMHMPGTPLVLVTMYHKRQFCGIIFTMHKDLFEKFLPQKI